MYGLSSPSTIVRNDEKPPGLGKRRRKRLTVEKNRRTDGANRSRAAPGRQIRGGRHRFAVLLSIPPSSAPAASMSWSRSTRLEFLGCCRISSREWFNLGAGSRFEPDRHWC